MKLLPVVVAVAFALGCRDASKDLEALADRACACSDNACTEVVIDDFVDFAKKNKSAKGDEDRAAKAAEKMMRCAIKAGADPRTLGTKLKTAGD